MQVLTETFLQTLRAQLWYVDHESLFAYKHWTFGNKYIACLAMDDESGGIELEFGSCTRFLPDERTAQFLKTYNKASRRNVTVKERLQLCLVIFIEGESTEGDPITADHLDEYAYDQAIRFFQVVSMYEVVARSSNSSKRLARNYPHQQYYLLADLILNDHCAS
jgi:hypothetical protein